MQIHLYQQIIYLVKDTWSQFVSSSASEVVIQKLTLLHINLIAATVLAFSEPWEANSSH